MKSFNLIPLPWSKTLVFGAVVFCSMAFRNPYTAKHEASAFRQTKQLLTDTVPKTDININIDLSKILADVDVALAKIDFEKIGKEIQLSLDKIDFTKIQNDIDASLKTIDWEKMNKDIQNSLKKIDNKKIQIQIQKSLEDARKHLDSKEFKQSMQRLKEVNMKDVNEELNKAKIELEKNKEELKRQLQKMKAAADEKDAVYLDNFGIEKSCVILI